MLSFIVMFIVGGILGWLAGLIVGKDIPGGIIGNIIAGIVGSFLGQWIFGLFGAENFGPHPGGVHIIPALIGTIVLVLIVSFIVGKLRGNK